MEQNTPVTGLTPRQTARQLYAQGLGVTEIARTLNQKRPTVQGWKKNDDWKRASIFEDVTLALKARLLMLIGKDGKSNGDYKELDEDMRHLEKMARIERYREGGTQADLNPNLTNRNKGPRKKPLKNQISQEQLDILEKAFLQRLYEYQQEWVNTVELDACRQFWLLKSRQIGATDTFALWALINGLKTGHNKIFLSASKAQAYQFIEYIKTFVVEQLEFELTGDPIVINGPNGPFSIYYLGTNALTAQGRHGDVLFDEFMWVRKFTTFRKVAAAMASQKMYKQIYLSTASSILHESYPFWAGTDGNRKLPQEIDLSHNALKHPARGVDGRFRQMVTIDDALARGCDRFSLEQLEQDWSEEELKNLFRCQFIDDSGSFFPFDIMEPNMVDSWMVWKDFKPLGSKKYDGPVWVGYDPSFSGDNAALAIIAPPLKPFQPYRILESHQYHNKPAHVQAQYIKKVCEAYNVEFFGIDNTGNGIAVAEHVEQFFPALKRLNYSVDVKTRMVLRAKELLTKRKLQYDIGVHDITKAFLSIKKTMTGSGRQMTYVASRSLETGHGDKAWAIMNALENAPIIHTAEAQPNQKPRIRIGK